MKVNEFINVMNILMYVCMFIFWKICHCSFQRVGLLYLLDRNDKTKIRNEGVYTEDA